MGVGVGVNARRPCRKVYSMKTIGVGSGSRADRSCSGAVQDSEGERRSDDEEQGDWEDQPSDRMVGDQAVERARERCAEAEGRADGADGADDRRGREEETVDVVMKVVEVVVVPWRPREKEEIEAVADRPKQQGLEWGGDRRRRCLR